MSRIPAARRRPAGVGLEDQAGVDLEAQPRDDADFAREMAQSAPSPRRPSPSHEPVSPPMQVFNITRIDSETDSISSQTVDPPAQAAATFIDGSDPLFSMFNKTTAEHDRKVVENWRSDADNAVIVNGLFSVMVVILLGRSYRDLRLNSQDVSAFYLSQIYQVSAGLNGTSTPPPFQVPDPSTFLPDSSSVWTSAVWSLSLVISLACTVIATLLRQWARQYLHITQGPRSPRTRARICQLVAQGVEREYLQRISSALPGLFHLSVFLFLSGLIISSKNGTVDLAIRLIALTFVGLYFFASILTIPPFGIISYTPLSSYVWFFWSRIVWLTYTLLYISSLRLPFIGYRTRHHLWESAQARLSETLRDTVIDVEALARKLSSTLDTSVVSRVFDSLDGHEDMEQFLSAIPGFYNSSEVEKDVSVLEELNDRTLAPAIASFMDHSLSSDLLTKPQKQQRTTICLQAINVDPLLLQCTFWQTLQTLNSDIFTCIDFVRLALEHLHRDDSDPWVEDYAQCIVAVAINRVHLDDGAWIDFAWRYLKPKHAQYRWEGHNLRLCNLIYLTRRLKDSRLGNSNQFKQGGIWRNVLAEALKFEIVNTALDLQLEFCALLNELGSVALGGEQPSEVARSNAGLVLSEMARSNAGLVLSSIRNAFLPLREGTAASSLALFSSMAGGQGPVLQWLASDPQARVDGRNSPIDPASVASHTHAPLSTPSPHGHRRRLSSTSVVLGIVNPSTDSLPLSHLEGRPPPTEEPYAIGTPTAYPSPVSDTLEAPEGSPQRDPRSLPL